MNKIRFIVSEPCSGAKNMAVDEILMRSAINQDQAFLRFYQWSPPTLSFGYNQPVHRLIDDNKAKEEGFELVRRMSGGKMVFHADEWTFSIGFPQKALKNSGNSFLQMFISAISPLVQGLIDLGIPARFSDGKSRQSTTNQVHCYASAIGHSIFAGEKKLIGAAGIAKKNFLIIHGSIPITVQHPPNRLFPGLKRINEGVDMACLKEFMAPQQILQLPQKISENFAKHFCCMVIKSELSVEEETAVEELALQKYSDLNWKDSFKENN